MYSSIAAGWKDECEASPAGTRSTGSTWSGCGAEQPPLARPHLTLDAVDSIEHNLGVVRAFLGLA
ncbi:MAG: hypothetical protein ACR2JK_06595 [Geodermatophilaceae bacterium]